MSPWPHKADDPSRRPQMKKRKGHASVLHAADVRRVVTERVAANGPERVSLRGRALADADAVQAVCDAVLALGPGGPNDGDSMTSPSPTVTLNLASGNVCGEGASRLAAFLLDPRCAVRELNLLDNPRLGVHLAEVADCPPAHAVEHTESDKVVDGFGCLALAAALQSPNCSLTRLNLGGCGLTCGGVSALASALMGDAPRDRDAIASSVGLSVEKDLNDNQVGAARLRSPSPSLLSINLRSNDVGYAGVVDLARAARAHGGVREMALGNNENVSDDAIRELEEVLRENRRNALVAELRDAAAPSCSGPEETFGSERSEDVRLKLVSLRRRHLRDEDAGTIAAALRPGGVADTLERLDLSDNELTAFGIDVLTHAIRGVAGNASLTHVSVAGNPGAHHDGGDAVRAESIANAMRLTDPRSLDARFKEGSKESSKEGQKQRSKPSAVAPFTVAARALHGAVAVNFLSRCGAGEALRSIADRGLGNEGAQEVAAAVSATAVYARDDRCWAFALESVGTQHNDIGAPGAEALAEAFSQLPNLKEWACYANPFGAGGARARARARRARPVPETRGTGHRGVRHRGRGVRRDRGGDRRPRAFAGAPPGPQRVGRNRGPRVARVHAAHRGDVAARRWTFFKKNPPSRRRRSKSLAARKPARPGCRRRVRPRARGAHRRARGRAEHRRRSRVRARARRRARGGDGGGGGSVRRRRRAPGA